MVIFDGKIICEKYNKMLLDRVRLLQKIESYRMRVEKINKKLTEKIFTFHKLETFSYLKIGLSL